ncbi:MAG: hypothetical protein AB7U18_27650 [Dehalococcoidia bacterium]
MADADRRDQASGGPPCAEPWPEEEGTGIFTQDGIELSEVEADEWAARIFGQDPSMPLPGDSEEMLAYLAARAAPPDSLAPAVSTLPPDPATEALRQAAIRRDLRQLDRERNNANARRVGLPSVPIILASHGDECTASGSRRLEPTSWWTIYVLRALGYLWCCAAGLLVAVGLGSIWSHYGWTAVQDTLSPFNVWQWLATAAFFAPGLLSLRAADWLEGRPARRRDSR